MAPRTLCGQPQNTSPQGTAAAQEDLKASELLFSLGSVTGQPSPGTETSAWSVDYETAHSGLGYDRFINVVAFNGRFNPQQAVSQLAQLDNNDYPFRAVPPGPHGGLMECAPSYGAEQCVFATSTTLGNFTFQDTLHELTGANSAVNAIRIRDALEVPAS